MNNSCHNMKKTENDVIVRLYKMQFKLNVLIAFLLKNNSAKVQDLVLDRPAWRVTICDESSYRSL